MTSIFSPYSSLTMFWMRTPRMPTQEPTGSTFSCRAATATFERSPGSRATSMISTAPLKISGHLQLEQPPDQPRVGARDDQLRAALVLVDLDQVDLQPLPGPIALGRHLLARGHHRLGLAQLDDDRARIGALDDAVEDLALPLGELVVDGVPLVVADALQDDLLGRLRGDAAEVFRRPLDPDLVADLGVRARRRAPRRR